jgi:nickel-dependent lactate racemase
MECWLPYGKTETPVRIADENLLGIIEPNKKPATPNPEQEIANALENPIGTRRVESLAKAGDTVCIVVDDKTSPLPSHVLVQSLVSRLNSAGVKDGDITVLFGCGIHSTMSTEEASSVIGEDCAKRVRLSVHEAGASDQVYLGETSRGTKVRINKAFAEADLKILTGDVQPHYFAGYGGGRKSVLPAIADTASIEHNHSFLVDEGAKAGSLERNPVHLDMVEAAHLAKPDFTMNVVLTPQKEIVKAFAGDMNLVFQEGVRLVDEICKVPVRSKADVVVASPGGHPRDLDLYHSCTSLDTAMNVVSNDGVIILVAECQEGFGNRTFYDWMSNFKTSGDMKKEIRKRFVLGGHMAYYLMRALEQVRIILVSTMPDYYASKVFHLRTAKTTNIALNMAYRMLNRKAKVLVMPQSPNTLPIIDATYAGNTA